MDYQQFVVEVKEKVAQLLGADENITVLTTLKNNGHERVGLSISNKEINISPTIYLEEYYEQFGTNYTLEEIAESIAQLYHEVKFEHTWDVNCLQDFSHMQSRIVYKLINAEKNELLLTTLPYTRYLDFAIVFYILFEADSSGTATIPVTNDLLHFWNTSLQELYDLAHENTQRLLPVECKPMHVVVRELLKKRNIQIYEDSPLFVLTNTLRCFGACCILYDEVLKEIGEQLRENYYLIPSSIHEMIVVPESKSPLREELNEIIAEINRTEVNPEEVLGNTAYYYDWDTELLS